MAILSVEEISQMSRKQLVKLDSGTIKELSKDPARLAAFNAIVSSPEGAAAIAQVAQEVPFAVPAAAAVVEPVVQTSEEIASAQEAERVAAENVQREQAEQQAQAAREAQAAELAAAGITIQYDANGGIAKIVKIYQARDEEGKPIGNPTHLEARTWPELSTKQAAAHENAMRLAERVKKQKVTFREPEKPLVQTMTDDQIRQVLQEVSTETDPVKSAELKQRVVEDEMARNRQKTADALKKAVELQTALIFIKRHVRDYNDNEANGQLLRSWVLENNLEFTVDSLEVAFETLKHQLAPVETSTPAPAAIPVNTPPAKPAVAAPAAPVAAIPPAAPAPAPAPQPVAAAPVTPVPANQPIPSRRPGINGGIPPGSFTGSRPTSNQQAPEFTMKDLKELSKNPQEMRRRIKMEPGFEQKVNALLQSRK